MKDPMVRTHTMLTSRLAVILVFAVLLFAVPFHAALAQAVLAGTAVTCTAPFDVTGDVDSLGAMTFPCSLLGVTLHTGDSTAQDAYNAFVSAYNALPGQQPCQHIIGGDLGSQALPLAPGVYCVPGLSETTGGTLTLSGPPNGIWIFRIGSSDPTGYLTGTGLKVVMVGGGLPCNVFWWVGAAATMTNSNFQGTILAGAAISITGGTFNGDALAHAAVTLVGPGTLTGCGNFTPPPPGDDDHDKGDKDKDHDKGCKDKDKGHDKGCKDKDKDHDKGDKDHDKGDKDHDKGDKGKD